jgi:hypothetical protein
MPLGLADCDNDTSGTHEDRMAIEGVVNGGHERDASQFRGNKAENRAWHHVCMNDIRLKAPAQTHQSSKIASERPWAALLTLAYLHAPHTMRVKKLVVMTSGAGVNDLMALPRLSAGQIDGDVDVPITMLAMLD